MKDTLKSLERERDLYEQKIVQAKAAIERWQRLLRRTRYKIEEIKK